KQDVALATGTLETLTLTNPANAPSSRDQPLARESTLKQAVDFALLVTPGPEGPARVLGAELRGLEAGGGVAAEGAAGLLPRNLQLNLAATPSQENVVRTLRAIGTDEAHATAKLISRGEVKLEFVPSLGEGVAGLQPFGTNKLQIALDLLPNTNRE